MQIFNKQLSQVELIKKLSGVMPRIEYANLTSQIVSLNENDPNRFYGNLIDIVA